VHNLARSYWGRAFEAIKYSSVAAECCGISRSHYKVAAFVLSAALAAFAGGLFTHLDNYVAPNTFAYNFSVEFLIALIFGGVRSVAGNVIGVALFVILPDVFSGFNDYRLMAYGLLLLVVLYFMPEGLMGVARGVWRRIRPYDPAPEHALLEQEAAGVDVFSGAKLAQPGEGSALKLEDLEMRFGGLYAVRDLTIEIPRGAVRGLIGPNGSGKSTTVNVLTGLYTPTKGRVVSFGQELNRLRPHERARQGIARTFQNLQLFSDLTVLENVMVGLHPSFKATLLEVALRLPRARREEREARARAYALLKFVGLEKLALERARNLAYGQARLLEIARALALSPSLLLLDEPAAGLTASEIESINALIRRIKAAGISILLIEHHMDMVMAISDDVTVLDFGKKIAEGSPRTIQADPLVIQAYLGTHSSATGGAA
jgi:branched-chain amino acid transport system permease protein